MVQTIKKGKHKSKPRKFSLKRTKDNWLDVVLFGPGLRYDHRSPQHQTAWNKIEGGSFSWFQPHGRAFMTAWRYLIELDSIEITFYYHNIVGDTSRFKKVGSVPGYVNEKNTAIIPIVNNKVAFSIARYFDDNTVKTEIYLPDTKTPIIKDEVNYYKIGRKYTLINFWFGGQKTAQNKVSRAVKESPHKPRPIVGKFFAFPLVQYR